MPGTKDILNKILSKSLGPLTSMVMCFEDAIKEEDVNTAEENVLSHLKSIYSAVKKGELSYDDIPLIFLRVRNTEQFVNFADKLGPEHVDVLSGFVFPKFYSFNAKVYLAKLQAVNNRFESKLYGMPILEGRTIGYRESRSRELNLIAEILEPFKELLLNVRVGGTDFSAIFGVRRSMNISIYEILPVRDCLSDILNFFNRDNNDYTVSAPVWEYFMAYKQDNIEHLLENDIQQSLLSRSNIINPAIDGLLREVLIDKANGFVGKTIIHPSHIKFVNGMQAITREEFEDASQILNTPAGVVKSSKSNKMNEINPHKSWARQTLKRGEAYGVVENEASYLKLILG